MSGRLEDGRYTAEFGWQYMQKLISVADRAGCTHGQAMVRALLLLGTVLEETRDGGTLLVRHADGSETEITGFDGEGEMP
jgi:hypothetical protein